MASTLPTVLFVHGTWHTPNHFKRVMDLFEANGFPCSCVQHPSVGHLPPIGLVEDAQTIRGEIKRLVETEQKELIIIAHSYGGVVTTQAADAEFARKEREAKGLAGGVTHLVYMCAYLLPLGDSLSSASGGGALPASIPVNVREFSFLCPWSNQLHK